MGGFRVADGNEISSIRQGAAHNLHVVSVMVAAVGRRSVLLPIMLLALSSLSGGCFSSEAPAGLASRPETTPDVRPEVTPPTFLPPVYLGKQELGAEPNLAIAQDGTVYVAGLLGLWRSDDGGRTFRGLGENECYFIPTCEMPNPGLDGGGDGSLVVAPGGAVHWLGLSGQDSSLPYQRSTDRGETWSDPHDLNPGNETDRQWLSVDDDGTLFGVWRSFADEGDPCLVHEPICIVKPDAASNDTLQMAISRDGGDSWTRTFLAEDAITGPLATDPTSDSIYLPVNRDGLHVLRSRDGGATWNATTIREGIPAFGLYIFPVASVDAAGNVYVVWSEDPDNPLGNLGGWGAWFASRQVARPHVYMAVSRDGGETFSDPILVSDPVRPAVFPWIDAGAPGRVAISWYDAVLPTPSDRAPNLWNVAVAVSTTADLEQPTFAVGFATPEPHHLGPICTQGLMCSLTAGDRSLLDFFEIRIHPDGMPIVAYAADADEKMVFTRIFVTKMDGGPNLRH